MAETVTENAMPAAPDWGDDDAPHVIIAGAGVAGLCAAYKLEQRGLHCTILEAESKHIGGRVRTHRFKNGQLGELGAMRIPEKHKRVRRYIAEFGLPTRPFVNTHPNAWFHMRGVRERRLRIDRIRARYALRPWEADQEPLALWSSVVGPLIADLTEAERGDLLSSNAWKTRKIHDLDHLSLHAALERGGLSPEAIELFTIAEGFGETLLGTAFTEHLREEVEEVWSQGFLEIECGMSRLPEAFLQKLRRKPVSGAEVIRIEQSPATGRVTAVYRQGGEEKRIGGDYLLCTLPFSVLQRVDTEPAFSAGKQRAIREIHYEAGTKVLFQTKRRFWETDDAIFGGSSQTDLLTGPLYYPSDNHLDPKESTSEGPGVLIASYVWGEAARRLGAMSKDTREELAKHLAGKVHPQLLEEGMIEEAVSAPWHTNPWSAGAFAFYMPGQFARLHRDVIAPEGLVHFAGEHTSRSHTWIEGAIESAERAADEIAARAGA